MESKLDSHDSGGKKVEVASKVEAMEGAASKELHQQGIWLGQSRQVVYPRNIVMVPLVNDIVGLPRVATLKDFEDFEQYWRGAPPMDLS